MTVKIRLTRMGKKKQPSYRVVVMDSRRPRDGAYIEQIGVYDPRQDPSHIEIDNERAVDWLRQGAQPTDRARKLLEVSGAWTRFRIAKGDIHTIADPVPSRSPVAGVATERVEGAPAAVTETDDEPGETAAAVDPGDPVAAGDDTPDPAGDDDGAADEEQT